MYNRGCPGGASGKEPTCQCRRRERHGFNPWIGKIPWRRKWKPTPVCFPGESHAQRSLADYSPWGHKESDTTEWPTLTKVLLSLFRILLLLIWISSSEKGHDWRSEMVSSHVAGVKWCGHSPSVLSAPTLRTFTASACTSSKRDCFKNGVSSNFRSHHYCLFVITGKNIHYTTKRFCYPVFVNYDWDQKHTKFQRKQLKGTSESNFPPLFVVMLLTANLPNWRLHVLDPTDHNHIHCRFPNRKCALYIFCCCPDWERERCY